MSQPNTESLPSRFLSGNLLPAVLVLSAVPFGGDGRFLVLPAILWWGGYLLGDIGTMMASEGASSKAKATIGWLYILAAILYMASVILAGVCAWLPVFGHLFGVAP